MTLTPEQMLLDLLLASPGIDARLAPNEDPEFLGGRHIRFTKQVSLHPEWFPAFIYPEQNEGREPWGYQDRINDGFQTWCGDRGWYVFRLHDDVHVLVPTEELLQFGLMLRREAALAKTQH